MKSILDNFYIYSRANGKEWLIPKTEPYKQWRATMSRFSTVNEGQIIYNDLCSPGTPEGRADLEKKIKQAKVRGWGVSSIKFIESNNK